MSWETLKLIIAGSLFLHATAHVIALFALLAESLGGSRVAHANSRSWLLPRLAPQAVAVVGSILWAASTTGFLVAAAGFWGLLATGATWRSLAITSAGVSILGIALRTGTWPGSPSVRRSALNTLVAMTMNVVIIVALAFLRWPPTAMFGR